MIYQKLKYFNIFILAVIFLSTTFQNSKSQNISLDMIQNSLNESSENLFNNSDPLNSSSRSSLFNQKKYIDQQSLTEDEKNLISQLVVEQNYKNTPLEIDYSKRAQEALELKGYDFFLINYLTSRRNPMLPTGIVQDDYVLGTGDNILLVFEGRENQTLKKKISAEGLLHLGFSEPVIAAGRSFREVNFEIQDKVKKALIETKVYASVENVRPINVTVIGEVNLPGVLTLTGMSSIMDALINSGGVKRSGSLRNITLKQNGKTRNVDLYQMLFSQNIDNFPNMTLSDNAIIFVPPIGKTVAISGNAVNSGIYELSKKNQVLMEIINQSGGFISKRKKIFSLKRFEEDGNEIITSDVSKKTLANDGDLFIIKSQQPNPVNQVSVKGAVSSPATYSLDKFLNINDLFVNYVQLKKTAYKFSILVKTKSLTSNGYNYNVYKLNDILNNNLIIPLNPMDEIFVLDKKDLNFFLSKDVLFVLKNGYLQETNEIKCSLIYELENMARALGKNGRKKFGNLIGFSNFNEITINEELVIDESSIETNLLVNKNSDDKKIFSLDKNENDKNSDLCPEIFENNEGLALEILDKLIILTGDVKYPGLHIVQDKFDYEQLLVFSGYQNGSVIISPDTKSIEVIKDKIHVSGEIRYPSSFDFNIKLKASDVINKKLINSETYPFIAVLERKNNSFSSLTAINPHNIINGKSDFYFQKGDTVNFFSQKDIRKFINYYEEEETFEKQNNLSASDEDNNTSDITSIDQSDITSIFENNNSVLDEETNKIPDSIINLSKLDKKNDNETTNENSMILGEIEEIFRDHQIIDSIYDNLIISHLVEIKGNVINPGSYPIGENQSIASLINFSGGYKPNADKKNIEVFNLNAEIPKQGFVFPGGKIFVSSSFLSKSDITLTGAFEEPRKISYKKGLSLSSIIKNKLTLLPNAYEFFGTIERRKSSYSENVLIPFAPINLIQNKKDFELNPGDVIKIYTYEEIKLMVEKYLKHPNFISPNKSMILNIEYPQRSGSISELVKMYSIKVDGSVNNPGTLLFSNTFDIEKIIRAFGGFSNNANLSNIQITKPSLNIENDIVLNLNTIDINNSSADELLIVPGSLIRVRKNNNEFALGYVEVSGAVNQPGIYKIMQNDTIFSMIKKTGGLQDNAFLAGMFFSREDEKIREQASIKSLQREIDKEISYAIEEVENGTYSSQDLIAIRQLARTASSFEALGRVVGDYNNIKTLKSIYVKSGDKITIPKRPSSVTVSGEIMTPGSIIWSQSKKVEDYINNAAGFTDLAEKSKIFVISPNGKAERVSSFWNKRYEILPGSTIVVPRRIKLASNLQRISAITSVVYQMTLTLAGIQSILEN